MDEERLGLATLAIPEVHRAVLCTVACWRYPEWDVDRTPPAVQVIDYGFPQNSSSEALKEFVLNQPILVKSHVSTPPWL